MNQVKLLREIREMRFEEAREGIPCEQLERTAWNDDCMSFDKLQLQIPVHQHCSHFVKARVRVHRYSDGAPAIFHGRGVG